MKAKLSRRSMMQAVGATAFAPSAGMAAASRTWPIVEGPDTPKLCLLSGARPIPWKEDELRARMERLKAGGLTLYNMMIYGFNNAIYARPGRDEEIDKVRQSIRAAGKAGLAVVEYNWYAHRAMEGYYEKTGRGGAGLTGFDYERMKGLPPLPQEGAHTLDEMWKNITYFLKAVIPVAEEAGVRLALHPNDPPAPLSRGSQQIMGTVAG